jgi:hypothetical protein
MPAAPVTTTAFGLLCACILLYACELQCAGPPLCVDVPLFAPLLCCACGPLRASFLLRGCVLLCACPLLYAIVSRCAGPYLPALKRLPDQLVLQAGWPRARVGYSIICEPFDRPCLQLRTEQLQPVSGHQGTFTVCALEISTADRLARMARLTYQFVFRVTWARHPNDGSGSVDMRQLVTAFLFSLLRSGRSRVPGQLSPGPHPLRIVPAPVVSGPKVLTQPENSYFPVVPFRHHSYELFSQWEFKRKTRSKRGYDDKSFQHTTHLQTLSSDSVTLDDDQKIADLVGVVYVANWIDF